MVQVTLVYADGTKWFAGGFPDLESAWAWIDVEKSRPYWIETTQIQVEVMPYAPPYIVAPDDNFGFPAI